MDYVKGWQTIGEGYVDSFWLPIKCQHIVYSAILRSAVLRHLLSAWWVDVLVVRNSVSLCLALRGRPGLNILQYPETFNAHIIHSCLTNNVEVCAVNVYYLGARGCGSCDRSMPVATRIGHPDCHIDLWVNVMVNDMCFDRHWGVTRVEDETIVTMQRTWFGRSAAVCWNNDDW